MISPHFLLCLARHCLPYALHIIAPISLECAQIGQVVTAIPIVETLRWEETERERVQDIQDYGNDMLKGRPERQPRKMMRYPVAKTVKPCVYTLV